MLDLIELYLKTATLFCNMVTYEDPTILRTASHTFTIYNAVQKEIEVPIKSRTPWIFETLTVHITEAGGRDREGI